MKKIFLVIMAMAMGMFLPANAPGEEIFALGGAQITPKVSTYSYAQGFHQNISGNFGGEILYINDGHADKDDQYSHRDGMLLLLAYDMRFFNERLVIRPLVGSYLFCDTQDEGAQIKNSMGGYAGVGMNLYLGSDKKFFIATRVGYALANASPNSFSFLAGAGFRFDPSKKKAFKTEDKKNNEISFSIGRVIPNLNVSGRKEDRLALSLQIRRELFSHIDLMGGILSEGWRNGIVMMPQAVTMITDKISAGIGIGPYVSYEDREIQFNGAVAITAAYEFNGGLVFRGTFMRILASQVNDSSDIFVAGVGYRF